MTFVFYGHCVLLSAGRPVEAIAFVRGLAIESRPHGPEGQTNKTHGAHEQWGSGRCCVVPDSHLPCFVISSGMLLPGCRYLGWQETTFLCGWGFAHHVE